MRNLSFSDGGYLINIKLPAILICGHWYPRMHRSGEIDTFVPRALKDMGYNDRYHGRGESFGFAKQDNALDFAVEMCRMYYKNK